MSFQMIEVWRNTIKFGDTEYANELPYYPHLLFFKEEDGVNPRSIMPIEVTAYFLYKLVVDLKIPIPEGLTPNSISVIMLLDGDDEEDEEIKLTYDCRRKEYLNKVFDILWNSQNLLTKKS